MHVYLGFILCVCEDTTLIKFGGCAMVECVCKCMYLCCVLCVALLSTIYVRIEKPNENKLSVIQYLLLPSTDSL